jgi:hypothetical protein
MKNRTPKRGVHETYRHLGEKSPELHFTSDTWFRRVSRDASLEVSWTSGKQPVFFRRTPGKSREVPENFPFYDQKAGRVYLVRA